LYAIDEWSPNRVTHSSAAIHITAGARIECKVNPFRGIVIQTMTVFMSVREIVKSDYLLRHVCPSVHPSVRMEQLGSHWPDFHENLILF